MKYMGSKARHARELLPIILKEHKPEMWYVEPFVGGANMLDKVPYSIAPKRIGCDTHEYLISMWSAVSKGWSPPKTFTEEQYNHLKNNKNLYAPELVGYVGFALSYGGKWFGGWRRDSAGKRDYVSEAYRNAEKQFQKLRGVKFLCRSVFDLDFSDCGPCTVYCDPPYRGTTGYKDSFDHERFYSLCTDLKSMGHSVFISEYEMPEEMFDCVFEKQVNSSLTRDTGQRKAVERLFVPK